jgi:hypothetical protein
MFERFTDRARRVVVLAQEQARMLNHGYIGSEHLLLGILSDDNGARIALNAHAVTYPNARAELQMGTEVPSGHIPFTTNAKKAIENSLRESQRLAHNEIRSEHLLLGILRTKKCSGAQVVATLADDVDALRRDTIAAASGAAEAGAAGFVSHRPARFTATGTLGAVGWVCAVCGRDLWDVDRFVRGERGTVCNACVEYAHATLMATNEREVTMPPRGYGEPRPQPEEMAAIQAAFAAAFGGEDDDAMEDSAALRPYFNELRERNPNTTAQFIVQRVRLMDADHARVRYALVVAPQGFHFQKDGEAVRSDGRWRVARSTAIDVLRQGGMQVPD